MTHPVVLVGLFLVLAFQPPVDARAKRQVHDNTLELVHVIFRHGDRTPDKSVMYKNDPYINETYYPIGLGQLTNHENGFKMPEWAARVYPKIRHLAIMDYNVSTATSQLKRLSSVREFATRTLRRPNSYCPVYLRELVKALQSEPVKDFLKEHKALMEYVQENSGKPMNKLLDVFSIYQTLTAERTMNLTLPEWSKSVYPHGITEVAAKQCEIENSNAVLKRLNGGECRKRA
ncbi:hypothetical protein NQ315_012621 [Exocentrus adspersus]|uniref:acid phosphatase n=1 Tax=Exocentrus adspersus TaxID=1586481 RepID=A0AAV8VRX9_9CUCU|nr:hypothetical protein NQ315_012621 [Exocentrus adspersus]